MEYYIQYHNFDNLNLFPSNDAIEDGSLLSDSEHVISTNKRVKIENLKGSIIFLILGLVYKGEKRYYLWSITKVEDIHENFEPDFKFSIVGIQHFIEPPKLLNKLKSFPEFMHKSGHFGLGLQKITDWEITKDFISISDKFQARNPTKTTYKEFVSNFSRGHKMMHNY